MLAIDVYDFFRITQLLRVYYLLKNKKKHLSNIDHINYIILHKIYETSISHNVIS